LKGDDPGENNVVMNHRLFSPRNTLKWVGVLALLLLASAVATTSTPNHNDNGHTPSVNPAGGGVSAPNQQSEKSIVGLATSDISESDLSKTKKSPNKKDVVKKKPTNSNSSETKKSIQPASDSMRRIKKEYKDAVQMGIAYDWVREKRIQPKKSKTAARAEEHRLICMGPLATNLRHWHFSFRGCGIYEDGIYHGRIMLPKNYPLTPPRVQVWTPSGRFVPYADICLSASAYHPESWTPRWTVLSLVQALRLHMLTNPQEIGGMSSNLEDTLDYARESLVWKLAFKAGKTTISVDHGKLQQQGLFATEDVEADKDVGTPSKISQNSSSGELATDEGRGNVVTDEGQGDDATANTHSICEIKESLPSDKQQQQQQQSSPISLREAYKSSSGDTTAVQTTKPKRKKKPKTSSKVSPARTVESSPGKRSQKGRRESIQKSHKIFLVLSKIFSSPTRIVVVFTVFLLWIISIP
jgi:ubiquitin-protein ligase